MNMPISSPIKGNLLAQRLQHHLIADILHGRPRRFELHQIEEMACRSRVSERGPRWMQRQRHAVGVAPAIQRSRCSSGSLKRLERLVQTSSGTKECDFSYFIGNHMLSITKHDFVLCINEMLQPIYHRYMKLFVVFYDCRVFIHVTVRQKPQMQAKDQTPSALTPSQVKKQQQVVHHHHLLLASLY